MKIALCLTVLLVSTLFICNPSDGYANSKEAGSSTIQKADEITALELELKFIEREFRSLSDEHIYCLERIEAIKSKAFELQKQHATITKQVQRIKQVNDPVGDNPDAEAE